MYELLSIVVSRKLTAVHKSGNQDDGALDWWNNGQCPSSIDQAIIIILAHCKEGLEDTVAKG